MRYDGVVVFVVGVVVVDAGRSTHDEPDFSVWALAADMILHASAPVSKPESSFMEAKK